MANITSTKKKTLLMKLAAAAPKMAPGVGGRPLTSDVRPKMGCSARASSEVTAIGSASVDHSTSIPAKSAASRCASGGSPSGVGRMRMSPVRAAAPRSPAAVTFEPVVSVPGVLAPGVAALGVPAAGSASPWVMIVPRSRRAPDERR